MFQIYLQPVRDVMQYSPYFEHGLSYKVRYGVFNLQHHVKKFCSGVILGLRFFNCVCSVCIVNKILCTFLQRDKNIHSINMCESLTPENAHSQLLGAQLANTIPSRKVRFFLINFLPKQKPFHVF